MNVLIGDNIVCFACWRILTNEFSIRETSYFFEIAGDFRSVLPIPARQLLRELPRQWRLAYLFFAFAYMLIVGTGERDTNWN